MSDETPEPVIWTHVTAKTLYGGTFIERAASIRALIFGEMVRIAENKVVSFRSDLFHDAVWINQYVTSPGSFEWVARKSGTHIGDPDYIKKVLDIFGDEPLLRFRFDIMVDDQTWKVVVSQAAPINVPDSVKTTDYVRVKATDVYPSLAKPVTDPDEGSEETPEEDSDGTFTEDDQGNWHPVSPTPVTVMKTTKENGTMDQILSELRTKVEGAESEKNEIDERISEIESAKENLETASEELDSFINEMNELISSLESIPEVSVYVDSIEIDSISFDSND